MTILPNFLTARNVAAERSAELKTYAHSLQLCDIKRLGRARVTGAVRRETGKE